jgi:protein ImuB
MLLRERLAQLCLPAPTLELRLHAADIARRAPPNGELFPTPRSERVGLTRLIERLQARLGRDQIRCVVARHDHRPEHASALCTAEPGMRGWGAHVAAGTAAATPRAGPAPPVWLLDPPEPLPERNARPVLDGRPLSILAGPERIEAGWWDAGLAERDYYIAQTDTGALVWVYRARLPLSAEGSGWYLQGRYG